MVLSSYRLALLRFSTYYGSVLFADFAVTVSLWLAGGPNEEERLRGQSQLELSITSFTFKTSVFDLVVLSLVKLFICVALLWKAENFMLKEVSRDRPFERVYRRRKRLVLILTLTLMLANFGYVAAKSCIVLRDGDEKSFGQSNGPPLTYGACLISASIFALIELGFSGMAFKYLNSAVFRKTMLENVNVNDEDGKVVGRDGDSKDGDNKKYRVPVHRVLGLAKPELELLIPATLFLLISTGAVVVAPRYFGEVIDAAVKKEKETLTKDVWILLAVFLTGSIAGMFRSFLFVLAGERLVARLRQRLFGCVMKQEVAFFDVTRTGELTSRLSSDTQVLQDAVTSNLSMLIRYILMIVASLVFMFTLSWKLTLVLLAVVPVVSIGAVVYGNYIKKLRKQFQDLLAEAGTVAEESISSIRTVRSFSNEDKSINDYNEGIDKSYRVGKKSALAIGIFIGCVFSVIQGACVLVLWYGSTLLVDGELSAGLLTSFMLYMFNIAMAFAFISNLYGVFMQAVGASTRIFQLLDRKPAIPIAGGEQLLMLEGSIEFHQVSFSYPSRPDAVVLKGISFQVEPGSVVALVGPSGGGKTTVVNLIERFYSPAEGRICLGGCDLMELDPKWFRQKVAMVGQEPVLFGCTIGENIAYGKNASQDEIEDVAKKANAHEFITGFEEGYNTLVGERGVRLSGGQKQRVAIARALLMNPTILLLDEATSALDAESEHLVQEAIDRAMVGRTVLVIAHRLSTVRNAHKVLVVDKGVIAESGTHDQLLSQDGVYKKLVLRQLQAGQANSF